MVHLTQSRFPSRRRRGLRWWHQRVEPQRWYCDIDAKSKTKKQLDWFKQVFNNTIYQKWSVILCLEITWSYYNWLSCAIGIVFFVKLFDHLWHQTLGIYIKTKSCYLSDSLGYMKSQQEEKPEYPLQSPLITDFWNRPRRWVWNHLRLSVHGLDQPCSAFPI